MEKLFHLEPGQLWQVSRRSAIYVFHWGEGVEVEREEEEAILDSIDVRVRVPLSRGEIVMVVGVREHWDPNADLSYHDMEGTFLCDLLHGEVLYTNQAWDPVTWENSFTLVSPPLLVVVVVAEEEKEF